MNAQLRASDVFCRLGGDEFLILCSVTDAEGAMIVAERARECVREVAGHGAAVTASLGIATYPHDAGDTATLLRNADAALYAAKARGRDLVCRYDDILDGEKAVTL